MCIYIYLYLYVICMYIAMENTSKDRADHRRIFRAEAHEDHVGPGIGFSHVSGRRDDDFFAVAGDVPMIFCPTN